jgi:hypothetical protein
MGAAALRDGVLAELVDAVQFNCDVADARHARDGALCTYLLGMREYYRWATGAPCGQTLEHGAVGRWIAQRESTWEVLCDNASAYRRLPLDAGFDAFDETGVNRALAGCDLVYGAGIGRFGVPLFFLAECSREERRGDVSIVITARELARGLAAPPALSRDRNVQVRTDAMRRWLWTRVEGWHRQPVDTAIAALLLPHGGDDAAAVESIVRSETETLVLHELGEMRAAERLGPDWERMLADAADRQTEVVLRAVRDLLADCLVTLPALASRAAFGSLHFWYMNFDGARRALAPEFVALQPAVARGELPALAQAAERAQRQWQHTATDLLTRWRTGGAAALRPATQALMRDCRAAG